MVALAWAWGASLLLDQWLADRPEVIDRWRQILLVGSAAISIGIVVGAWVLDRVIDRWIGEPARELVRASQAIARGDLSVSVEPAGIDDVRRLSESIGAMLAELRELAAALAISSRETTSLAQDITAATEQMAAASGEVAHTASDLSQQSAVMAQTVQKLTESSAELQQLAEQLSHGAHEGVERNVKLRALANENRARLDAGARALVALGDNVQASVAASESLVTESQEIQQFLVLIRKLARQSKLLALNAAMEAARAGEHGEGFAVVAHEVRRLAQMSGDAAERTEQVVNRVLGGVEQVRSASSTMEATVRVVREATEEGVASFSQIEEAVTQLDGWTAQVDRTAGTTYELTREATARLGTLAAGMEGFAAAMEQVAASSQEQSAGNEEVAAAASSLTLAAAKLEGIVGKFRLAESGGEPDIAPRAAVLPMAAD